MSTHVLDKQFDKMLRDEGIPDSMTRLVGKGRAVGYSSRRLCFCHLLLTLVDLGAQAR